MEFEEVFMSQFTTATTCYSGARNPQCTTLGLATANHVLGVKMIPASEEDAKKNNEDDKKKDFQVSCDNLPQHGNSTTVICVGFSQWDENLQALAMVDPAQMEDLHLQETPHLYYPPTNDREDSMSVASNAYSVPDSSSSTRGHHRRPSGNVAASTASVSISTSSINTNNTGMAPTHNKSNSDISSTPVSGMDTANATGSALPQVSTVPKKARLVLQTPQEEYSTFLDFRPLCPCVVRWGKNKETVGIWVGSAEDAQLRFYVPQQDDDRMLYLRPLPEEHFTVDSPVMALDFNSTVENKDDNAINTLAVACQNGTIHILSWKGDDFDDLNSFKVIVDGPLVSLQLQQPQHNSLHVVIGSLCGYVCQLVRKEQKVWEGPSMVVQGFWNEALEAEDSVLAVHVWDDDDDKYIAIGTHAGRCLLYTRRRRRQSYDKVWECLLPYSVHGIVVPKNNNDDAAANRILRLVVTTRRSLHIFQLTNDDIGLEPDPGNVADAEMTPREAPRYSADFAKQRLLELLPDLSDTTGAAALATASPSEETVAEEKEDVQQHEESKVHTNEGLSSSPQKEVVKPEPIPPGE